MLVIWDPDQEHNLEGYHLEVKIDMAY
jgi:hypothetical protein